MIQRKAAVYLSLLSVLLLSALIAQGASGAAAKNTTPVTCVKGGGNLDFKDEHCDEKVADKTGSFGHVALASGTTFISMGNANTGNNTTTGVPWIMNGIIFGVKMEITCTTAAGEGSATGSEPVAKEHKLQLSFVTKVTSCTLNKPAGFGCKVKEPIEFKLNGEGVEGLGAGKNEMGIELKPTEGEVFSEFTIEGCFLSGTYKITGTAVAVGTPSATEKHSGATFLLTKARTKETLKLAGNPAEISSAKTIRMAFGGNPISFTTTT